MIICDNLPPQFSIRYKGALVTVEPKCAMEQMRFLVHLPGEDKEIFLLADHLKNETWHEAYKGETQLADALGKLIEQYNNSL